jgi:hypothetical protein
MPVQAEDYGLVIGIDHYPEYRNLQGACADAEEFDAWLIDTEIGGGVPEQNRRRILSQPDPVRPIQDEIDEALESLLSQIGDQEVRRFYLYFSGHGLASSRMGADLCLGKWSPSRRNCALDSNDYFNMLIGTGKFREIIGFLDCCRVRVSNAHGLGSTLGWARPDDDAGSERHFIGYSTEYQNPAFEAATGQSQGDVRGFFTKALLQGLKGAAASTGGGVPASRLADYVIARTRTLAATDNRKQIPEVSNTFTAANEPIFGSAPPSRRVTVTFTAERVGHDIELIDPGENVLEQFVAGTAPMELPLGSGLHLLADTTVGVDKRISEGDTHVEF